MTEVPTHLKSILDVVTGFDNIRIKYSFITSSIYIVINIHEYEIKTLN